MAEWQPIETAPSDKWILLWFVTVNPANSGVVMAQISSREDGKLWDGHIYRDNRASHWMPLPEPPK